MQAILAFSDTAGPAGVAVFIAVYAVSCVLLIPASLLTLGAGALYGPFLGTAVVSAASTLGCSLAFLISRYVARPFAEKRLMANERFVAVDTGISRKGGYIVFLLRLSPLVPFGLMNYMMGAFSAQLSNLPYNYKTFSRGRVLQMFFCPDATKQHTKRRHRGMHRSNALATRSPDQSSDVMSQPVKFLSQLYLF